MWTTLIKNEINLNTNENDINADVTQYWTQPRNEGVHNFCP
jgi:hypothetical protein